MIGQTIGNYRIESLLGTGGMGQVYRASHVHLGRIAAVKIMHPNLSTDADFRARFLQEAKAAAVLEHPNIVQIYDFGEQGAYLYLVMELVGGGSLRTLEEQAATRAERVPLPLGLALILQTAVGLSFAHDKHMVHRDIKPDNLLLQPASSTTPAQPNYVVKIGDFGLARLAEDGIKTSAGMVLGTPAYMSPEQVKGEPLDGRSDIYSLGVVLYELAVGKRPFDATTLSQAVYQHVFVPPQPPRALAPHIPPVVEEIILRCLAKPPQDRYGSALELVADLHRALAATPSGREAASTPQPSATTTIARVDAEVTTAFAAMKASNLPTEQTQNVAPAEEPPPASVTVSDEDGHTILTVPIKGNLVRVGRTPDNDVVLAHQAVSRYQCEVRYVGGKIYVADLNSSNGTYLQGTKLQPSQPVEWLAWQTVRIGPYKLALVTAGQAADQTLVLAAVPPADLAAARPAAAKRDIVMHHAGDDGHDCEPCHGASAPCVCSFRRRRQLDDF